MARQVSTSLSHCARRLDRAASAFRIAAIWRWSLATCLLWSTNEPRASLKDGCGRSALATVLPPLQSVRPRDEGDEGDPCSDHLRCLAHLAHGVTPQCGQ